MYIYIQLCIYTYISQHIYTYIYKYIYTSLSLSLYIYIYTYIYIHIHTSIYIHRVSLTSTTLSRRLTMHLSDTSSIAQHLKKYSCPTIQQRNNTTTTIQQYSTIRIINKNFRFSKHYISDTCNRHLIELTFKPVLMYLNVFSYWHYSQNYI